MNDTLSSKILWGSLIRASPPVLLNTDGSLSTLVLYRPRDLSLASDTERDIYLDRLTSLLQTFGTNWHLHFDAHTAPTAAYQLSTWHNPTSAFVDALHALPFTSAMLQETDYYLTVTQTKNQESKTKFFDIFSSRAALSSRHEEEVALFLDRVQTFAASLTTLLPFAALATSDQLCTYLHRAVSPSHTPVQTPEHPYDLANQLTDTPLLHAYTPALGHFDDAGALVSGNYVRPISIKSWPRMLSSIIPTVLQSLSFPYRLSVKWSPLDIADAQALIKQTYGRWKHGFTNAKQLKERASREEDEHTHDVQDLSTTAHAVSMIQAEADLHAQVHTFGYLTPLILLSAPTTELLTIRTREVLSLLQIAGCVLTPEDVGATHAYLSSLPCHTDHTPRTVPAPSPAASFLLPHTSIWSGPSRDAHYKAPPLFTAQSDGSPFRFALHPGNSELGSAALIGPSGSGKSGGLGFFVSQFQRYDQAQVFIFDKDYQLYGTTLLHGGTHYDLCGDTVHAARFAPFVRLGSAGEDTWCLNWILQLFTHQQLPPTAEEKTHIYTSLQQLADFPTGLRTLTGFSQFLRAKAPRLIPALLPYLRGGPYGFFDASEDSLALSRITTFEMKHLLALPDALPHALRYIFHRIESRFDGSPTLIVQDECHLLHTDPTFSVENIKYCKEGRRFNVASLFASQELFYLQALPTWHALKGAIKTWLWTPNDKAEDLDVAAFYQGCGLSPHHCAILARSTPKQDYLYQSDAGMRRFQLALSPIERLLCAASTVNEIAQLRALASAELQEALPAAWLRLNGYTEEADIYNDHYVKDQEYDEKGLCHDIGTTDSSVYDCNRSRTYAGGVLSAIPRAAVNGTNGVHVHA